MKLAQNCLALTLTPRRQKATAGKPLPAGVHRGIAKFMGYGSYSAAVAEVSVSAQGKLTVHRRVLALNCGHAVNPDQIAAQVEGSVAYGLSAALYGECTVDKGRIAETNFHTVRDPAARRDAQGRDRDRAVLRFLGRRRGADHLRGAPAVVNAIQRGDRRRSTRGRASSSR